MGYSFIVGGSGSGKTHEIYTGCIEEAIKNPKKNFIIIVPEQYTLQTQRKIVKMHPNHATSNIDVVSFNRLAYRIFTELNIKNPEVIDDIGKAMILRKVALDRKDNLSILKNKISKIGFLDSIKSLVSELYQYDIRLEDLKGFLEDKKDINPVLNQKLKDMYILYEGFDNYIKDNYITTEQILDVLSRVIYKSEIIKNSYIILDGFTGFSPIQYRIIELLLIHSLQVDISLNADSVEELYREQPDTYLFLMSKTVVKNVSGLAAKNNIKNTKDIDIRKKYELKVYPRFIGSESLAHLENNFLREKKVKKYQLLKEGDNNKDISYSEDRNIDIVKCQNPDEEIRVICGKILDLIKNKGYRYKDIAIVTGDIEGYSQKISARLYLSQIPYYIDSNISLSHNELVEFIKAVLSIFVENYSYDSIMRYVRSGLSGALKEDIWLMDNYMMGTGISGIYKMKRDWTYRPDYISEAELERINLQKNNIIKDLSKLHKVFNKKNIEIEEIIDNLVLLLEKKDAENKLLMMSDSFKRSKSPEDIALAREYEYVYTAIIDLFSDMKRLLASQKMNQKDFVDILDAGISQISVGIIPQTMDRVLIGDITRTRLDAIKALFVIGAIKDSIPKLDDKNGIINDREKEYLKDKGLILSETMKEEIFIQRYYMYLTITKPSNKLFISYPAVDFSGKSVGKSILIKLIQDLYVDSLDSVGADLTYINCAYEAKEYMISALRDIREKFLNGDEIEVSDIFKRLYSFINIDKFLKALAYIYKDKSIGKLAAQNIFGRTLNSGITRLEQYVGCPYSHFLKYGLGLKEKKSYGIEAVDIGNLVHSVIERVFLKARAEEIDLLKYKNTDSLVDTAIKEAVFVDERNIYSDTKRNEYLLKRITDLSKKTIWVLISQLKKGDFIPYAFEYSFNDIKSKTMDIDLGNELKLKLRGKIDRIDLYEDADKVLVKIIDYKTGKVSWEPDMVYYGKQLQLVMYLDAISNILSMEKKGKQVLPAGMFYYNIDYPMLNREQALDIDNIDSTILGLLKPNGLVNTDLEIIRHLDKEIEKASDVIPVVLKDGVVQNYRSSVASTKRFEYLKDYVNSKVKNIATDILEGDISINPYKRGEKKACDYCKYSSVCGFDKNIEGYDYNKLYKLKPEQVWEKIEDEDEMD